MDNQRLTFGLLRKAFQTDLDFVIELTYTKSDKKDLLSVGSICDSYDRLNVVKIYEGELTIGVLLNGAPESDDCLTVEEVLNKLNIHQPIEFAFNGVEAVKERYEYMNPTDIPEEFKTVSVVNIESVSSIQGWCGLKLTLNCDPPNCNHSKDDQLSSELCCIFGGMERMCEITNTYSLMEYIHHYIGNDIPIRLRFKNTDVGPTEDFDFSNVDQIPSRFYSAKVISSKFIVHSIRTSSKFTKKNKSSGFMITLDCNPYQLPTKDR